MGFGNTDLSLHWMVSSRFKNEITQIYPTIKLELYFNKFWLFFVPKECGKIKGNKLLPEGKVGSIYFKNVCYFFQRIEKIYF